MAGKPLGANVGSAWVSLRFSADNAGKDIKREVDQQTAGVGQDAGKKLGKDLSDAFDKNTNTSKTTKRVQSDLDKIGRSFDKASKASFFKPSIAGAWGAGLTAALPVASAFTGAIATVGTAFGAATIGAGLFGIAAKSVLTSASADATKLATLQQKLATDTTLKQKKATDQQITNLEHGWSKGYKSVVTSLGGITTQWHNMSRSLTIPALSPWLDAVNKGMKFLKPVIAPVANVFKSWGETIDKYFSSNKGSAEINHLATVFGKFASSQLRYAGTFFVEVGKGIGNLDHALGGTLVANATAFGSDMDSWGKAFDHWSASSKARTDVQNLMASIGRNGSLVTGVVKSLAKFLPQMFAGASAIGTAELKALNLFFGLVAKLPPSWVKPLTEAAGAMLLLSKTGVLKVGFKLVGLGAQTLKWLNGGSFSLGGSAASRQIEAAMVSGGKAAAAEIRGAMAAGGRTAGAEEGAGEVAGGATAGAGMSRKLVKGGATIAAAIGGVLVARSVLSGIKEPGTTNVGGKQVQKNWWQNPFDMPGPGDKSSSKNFLTSWSPYENFVTKTIPGWFHTATTKSTKAFSPIDRNVQNIAKNAANGTLSRFGAMGAGVTSTFNKTKSNASSAMSQMQKNVGNSTALADQAVKNHAHNIQNNLDNTGASARSLTKNVNGLTSALGKLPKTEHTAVSVTGQGTWSEHIQGANGSRTGGGIGGFASGTGGASPGWAWVGERGRELVQFHGGETVLSHPQSMQVTRGYANGTDPSYKGSVGGLTPWTKKNWTASVKDMTAALSKGVRQALSSYISKQIAGSFGGGVAQWAGTVLKALAMLHLPKSDLGLVLHQMQTESSGRVNAINLTDSNAAAGDPSRGLMQVIGGTFARWHVPGTSNNIYDPLANIAAALNYAEHTPNVGIGTSPGQLGGGTGYDEGGIARGMGFMPKRTIKPERVLSPNQTSSFEKLVDALDARNGGSSEPRKMVITGGKLGFDKNGELYVRNLAVEEARAEIKFAQGR